MVMEYSKATWPVVCLVGRHVHAYNLAMMVTTLILQLHGIICMLVKHKEEIHLSHKIQKIEKTFV